jgi:CHC2 zinc finger
MSKPSIRDVVSQRVQLRKAGNEYVGLCPFHEDKTPSFSVNEDKGIFHCFGCDVKGDVYGFTMQIEGIGFRQAKARLGVRDEYRPKPPITAMQREAAKLAAAWMVDQRRKVNVLLGEVLEKIELADDTGDGELAESFILEQSFLRDLYEDLEISRYAAALVSIRPIIEALTQGVETPEIHFEFPELTQEYRARLEALAKGDA